jgi:hypothetical protein
MHNKCPHKWDNPKYRSTKFIVEYERGKYRLA